MCEEGRHWLEQVDVEAFGTMNGRSVGPFSPGLNVVYGPNESGKTTVAQMVRGVLFGWPAARGKNNPYRPNNANRAGRLVFRLCEGAAATAGSSEPATTTPTTAAATTPPATPAAAAVSSMRPLVLARNDFEAPPVDNPISGGMDAKTYDTLFSLTSDELLGLDNSADLTARLLQAGSGSSSSPAVALQQVESRIKDLTSKAASQPGSLPNLQAEVDRLAKRQEELHAESRVLLGQQARLADLEPQQQALAQTQDQLDDSIGMLRTRVAQLSTLDARLSQARANVAETQEELRRVQARLAAVPPTPGQKARAALRVQVADLEHERISCEHNVAASARDLSNSQAEYDRLNSIQHDANDHAWRRRQRMVKLGCVITVTVALAAFGAFVAYQSFERGSLTYLGIATLLLIGAAVAGAGGASALLRPTKEEERAAEALQKAEWVMRQDAKSFDQAVARQEAAAEDAARFLDANGLQQAVGSPKRALALLDQEEEASGEQARLLQQQGHLQQRLAARQDEQADLEAQRAHVCEEAGVHASSAREELDAALVQETAHRRQVRELAQKTSQDMGRIAQQLQSARQDQSYDRIKLERSQAEARLDEAKRRFAVLLLARLTLQDALSLWESQRRPQTFEVASQLFVEMTGGTWIGVRRTDQGRIVAIAADHRELPSHLLSLGTRQQLYLAVRMALLMCAQDVGPSLPVIADDILVNFDAARRVGAARALARLAHSRQVIVFTCHEGTAKLLAAADPSVRRIDL